VVAAEGERVGPQGKPGKAAALRQSSGGEKPGARGAHGLRRGSPVLPAPGSRACPAPWTPRDWGEGGTHRGGKTSAREKEELRAEACWWKAIRGRWNGRSRNLGLGASHVSYETFRRRTSPLVSEGAGALSGGRGVLGGTPDEPG
jgi:hypothetical protein